jgi:hypothetical protein
VAAFAFGVAVWVIFTFYGRLYSGLRRP